MPESVAAEVKPPRVRQSGQLINFPGQTKSKLAEQTATQIEQHIIDIGWPVDALLGSETDLAAQYGVSRWILREAVGIAERNGLVVMKRGRNGGLFVAAPASDAVVGVIRSYLAFANPTLDDLVFVRRELENYMVCCVCEQMRADQIDELRKLIVNTVAESDDNLALLGIAMLRKLLEVADNPALQLFTLVVSNLTITASWRRAAQPMTREIVRCRREQIEFLIAGDLAHALEREAEHLSLTHFRMGGSHTPPTNLRQRAFEWFIAELEAPGQLKLPQRVAYQIQDDILELNCPAGTHLGLEPELMRKYKVSRAVFREAVRSLERLGVVEMRSGHNSGLKVALPNPDSTVQSASRYLRYLSTPIDSMIELLTLLEVSAVERFAAAPDRAEALMQTVMRIHSSEDASTSLVDATIAFDGALAQFCGNQIVSVFLKILIETLTQREALKQPDDADDVAGSLREIEAAFCDALVAKDTPRARRLLMDRRRRITTHLAATKTAALYA